MAFLLRPLRRYGKECAWREGNYHIPIIPIANEVLKIPLIMLSRYIAWKQVATPRIMPAFSQGFAHSSISFAGNKDFHRQPPVKRNLMSRCRFMVYLYSLPFMMILLFLHSMILVFIVSSFQSVNLCLPHQWQVFSSGKLCLYPHLHRHPVSGATLT